VGRIHLKQAQPRPPGDRRALQDRVREILDDIAAHRDDAIRRYAREFDRWPSDQFRVSEDQIRRVERALPETFKEDFAYAHARVTDFAKAQRDTLRDFDVEIEPGITLGQKMIPVAKVGCYVPGGKYPLISAAIMSVATARVAGVEHVVGRRPRATSRGSTRRRSMPCTPPAPTRSTASAAFRPWRPWPMAASAWRRAT
jgi:sulfopropanediol 3-dehydrogenase